MMLTSPSSLKTAPQRIVSLVPSQTELLYDLALEDAIVGITKYCIHPPKGSSNKLIVGGTKTIDIQKLIKLNPDLIIANKEENIKEQVEELAGNFPVWVTNVNNLDDALQMISDIGELTHKKAAAQSLLQKIKSSFSSLALQQKPLPNGIPTCYLIWKDPYMTIGSDTFIHDMLQRAGYINVFAHKKRYPPITLAELQDTNCALLLLSSEPYPFQEKQLRQLQGQLPQLKIALVDAEMFSWYGSRLLKAPAYFKSLMEKLKEGI
jgi:ABC-type Fe3+-hydroxamate transport system substrate-binding protein